MTQYRTKASRKGKPLFLVNRYLKHPIKKILNRILYGDYLLYTGVNFGKGGV